LDYVEGKNERTHIEILTALTATLHPHNERNSFYYFDILDLMVKKNVANSINPSLHHPLAPEFPPTFPEATLPFSIVESGCLWVVVVVAVNLIKR